MNLILSDVEETILIVDQAEGAGEGQHTVNVRLSSLSSQYACSSSGQMAKRKMDMLFVRGDGVILVRVSASSFSFALLTALSSLGFSSFTIASVPLPENCLR